MDAPDFKALALSIGYCNASYIMDEAQAIAAFEDLGSEVLDRMSTDHGQTVLHRPRATGIIRCTNAGTRASEGSFSIRETDIEADALIGVKTVDGVGVFGGIWDELDRAQIYQWALSKVPATAVIDFDGHSKAGVQTTYVPLVVPAERIGQLIAWEPPKQFDAAGWKKMADAELSLLMIAHGADAWFSWPWVSSLNHGPDPFLWIKDDGTWAMVTEDEWPGGLNFGDHGPGCIVDTVRALAAQSVAA